MTEKKRFWIFILVAFGGGWAFMGAGMLAQSLMSDNAQMAVLAFQGVVAVGMFAPLLGVLVSHGGLGRGRTGIAWHPNVRGHGRFYLLAWFGPAVLTIVCAALYFLLFPAEFDGSLSYVTAQLPAGTELPMPPAALAAVQLAAAVTYAPFINTVLAVGEEAGWRGFMTPYLTERFGRTKGLLLSGAIWAAWHWPLILLAGYEYGTGYFGAPFTGMLLMCVACAAMGTLLTWLYERSDSIWAPALAHGAVNAAAGLGVLFMRADNTSLFLGPTLFGLVAGIPLFALALWALLRGAKPKTPDEAEPPAGI